MMLHHPVIPQERAQRASVGIYRPGAVTGYGAIPVDADTSYRSCGMTNAGIQ
jgi:hypothetical protein